RSCESEVLRSNGRSEGPCSNALWRAASEVEDQPALVLSKRPYLLLNARGASPSMRERRINVCNMHDYRQSSKWRTMVQVQWLDENQERAPAGTCCFCSEPV